MPFVEFLLLPAFVLFPFFAVSFWPFLAVSFVYVYCVTVLSSVAYSLSFYVSALLALGGRVERLREL